MGSKAGQLQVLFFPFMSQGHMIPMIDIVRLFSLRGVKSTILTTPHHVSSISSKITRYQKSGLDIDIITILFPFEEAGLPRGCESVDSLHSIDMSTKFFGTALPMMQPQFEQILQQLQPDCIVADMFFPWTTDAARKYGIPRLVFHGINFFSLCVMDSLKRYSPHECETKIFVVPGLPDEITMKKSQMPEFWGSNDIFDILTNQIRESEETSYGILVNSVYELEPAYAAHFRKVMNRQAWHIGPVSLSNSTTTDKAERGKKAGIDEHYCLNWLNSKGPNSVIYVSFGSVICFGSAQLIEIARGLEASGVSFIWVVRKTNKEEEEESFLPEGFEERMEGKGLVIIDWAPQVLILEHPAIGGFMTHCGWNSTLESCCAGVPMITWPLFADQFKNEILLTQILKIGIKVGAEKWQGRPRQLECVLVGKEKVEEVVTQLMKNGEGEEMRKKARELKEIVNRAVQEGGSSYSDLSALIEELQKQSALTKQNNV